MRTLRTFVLAGLALALAAGLSMSAATLGGQQQAVLDSSVLAGLSLREIGPANVSGRIVDLAVVESDPATFYIATSTGGLWKTKDNAITLEPVFFKEAVHSIGAVAISQSRPDIVWVGTGERANRQSTSWGNGVYKSTDAGRTWTHLGLDETHHVGRIVIHPTNPDIVYVAGMGHLWGANEERGLFKTIDGGKTWTKILYIDDDTGVVDVAMDPARPNTIYAASYQRRRQAYGFHGGGPGSALHKSTDGGRTWTRLTRGLPEGDWGRAGIAIYRKDPRIVYVCVEQGLRYTASTSYEQRLAGIYRSEDRGASWTHMSDWNPRPMYASQILVDPNDDQRIYMVNSYSYSDDGGKTFTTPRQTLHGDDRLVWVNPANSRHIIKADDGGLGISYDRGLRWLYVPHLPVSQFYRIDADMREPYWLCGGLQDNGGWCGPSTTYSSQGILNEDWFRVGGGDGFFHRIDPTDYRTVYTSSQYLGLSRLDIESFDRTDIRPGDPTGHIGGRRNWKTWGQPGADEPLLGNAMEPANWDAPFILSPHDPNTIYAGTRHLWKSIDRGDTWVSLGDPTTGVDRSTLAIMGQKPGPETLSLDDGVPYYPTISALAESPLRRGLLYAGTDDGNLQVSRDDGKAWTNVAKAVPGLPARSWVSGIEASRHAEGTVYVAFDNHASDDFRNYVYRSVDFGKTWTSIAGDLPANRVVKAVHEDPVNPNLLYVGTEFGFFLSIDSGSHWVQLDGGLPTVPVNDFLVHPRDNDLILATHGRGIWILDNITAIQRLTPELLSRPAVLFDVRPARTIRYANLKAHQGDTVFRGENPPAGAIIDYYLRESGGEVAVSIHDMNGKAVRRLDAKAARGLNRLVWDLRHEPFASGVQGAPGQRGRALEGPFVRPGQYKVRLAAGGTTSEVIVRVDDDPRIVMAPSVRESWMTTLMELGELYKASETLIERARTAADSAANGGTAAAGQTARAEEVVEAAGELRTRIAGLYREIQAHAGPATADQQSQLSFYPTVFEQIEAMIRALK